MTHQKTFTHRLISLAMLIGSFSAALFTATIASITVISTLGTLKYLHIMLWIRTQADSDSLH